MSSLAADPDFRAVAQVIFGDLVDVEELAKSLDASDVHVDGPMGSKRQKRIAAAGAAASGVALVGGLHALKATTVENGERAAKYTKDAEAVPRILRKVPASTAAKIAGGSWLALHGVELAGDTLAIRAQRRELKSDKTPVAKGVKLRVRPVNPEDLLRRPTLKAVRPAGAPKVVTKGMIRGVRAAATGTKDVLRNVQEVSGHANQVSADVAEITGKVKRLVPSPKKAKVLGAAAAATAGTGLGVIPGVATYEGSKRGTRAGLQKASEGREPVAADVEITKIGDKQQVFGWANVSTWNGQPVVDRQGDEIGIEDLEKAAYDYVLDSRVGGDQHRRTPVVKFEGAPLHTADVIESMVFTPDKIEKMGLPADFPQGWWIGMQIHDPEVWELVKSGRRTGFSVHGTGRRTPLEKADESKRAAKHQVRERVHQAVHPPAVAEHPVQSSAMSAMGYQPQTHRLSVRMNSRPDAPYQYRVKPATAAKVLSADSKGKAYTSEIRGKAKRVTPGRGYTPADRARLFAHPQEQS